MIDLARNIPAHDVSLVAPSVELQARRNLHPALCDLLIEAAQEVHGGAGLLKRKGQFPAPVEHESRLHRVREGQDKGSLITGC